MKSLLAIIIPAYKAKFLDATLRSIAAQTCKEFTLYIGDDNSPESIEEIINPYRKRLQLTYIKFNENLGKTSLAKHWERCISLSDEPWVWLFSDDDMMAPRCVENFLAELNNNLPSSAVYRFNTKIINKYGDVVRINHPHPRIEEGIQFLYFWLRGLRNCTMPDLIFSRKAFMQVGGFVELPLAWGSDVVMLLKLSVLSKIVTIDDSLVYFRNSGYNISTSHESTLVNKKIEAYSKLLFWLRHFLKNCEDTKSPLSQHSLWKIARDWFLNQIQHEHTIMSVKQLLYLSKIMEELWGTPANTNFMKLLKLNCSAVVSILERKIKLLLINNKECI